MAIAERPQLLRLSLMPSVESLHIRQPCRPARPRLAVWLLVIALVVLLSWLKSRQNEIKLIEISEHSRQHHSAYTQRMSRITEVQNLLLRGRLQRWSPQQLAIEVNEGQPLPITPVASRSDLVQVVWSDAPSASQWWILLNQNGQIVSFLWRDAPGTGAQPVPVPPPDALERGREFVVAYAPGLWLLLFLLVFVGPLREPLAESLLMTACTLLLAEFVAPYQLLSWNGIATNEQMPFTLLMLGMSIAVLAAVKVSLPADAARPRVQLQFSVRSLLLATFVCGAVLAMGRFGAILATSAICCWAAYFALSCGLRYSLSRQPDQPHLLATPAIQPE